jgi:hypothetical protein
MTHKDVFVSDREVLATARAYAESGAVWSGGYEGWLIGTGYSRPGSVITRWRDEQKRGEWFRVEVPDTGTYTADDPPIRVN